MPTEIWIGLALMPPAFLVGRIYKRRIRGGQGFTMKQQLKHVGVMAAVLGLLLVALAFADTPQKPPPLASAVRSGAWRFSGKEIALPQGPLCQTHAVIMGRHVTLKVAGAQVFEATLAITRPQHKRGNVLSVYVDNAEVESVTLQYGQEPHLLRIPLGESAQTLTLVEQRSFPSILICSPRLS